VLPVAGRPRFGDSVRFLTMRIYMRIKKRWQQLFSMRIYFLT
jgi:hypothetical protein